MVVGVVASPRALVAAQGLPAQAVDFCELRVDQFASAAADLRVQASTLEMPLIITVRHSAEGGATGISLKMRRLLYSAFLPLATCIDVELRSLQALKGTVQDARSSGVRVILSAHDFGGTPSAARLQETLERAADAGADIIKIAARAERPADLQRLLGLFDVKTGCSLSVMAMGHFGKVSRLLFAQAGSVLNYGYLGEANASGQWPALELRKRLIELDE